MLAGLIRDDERTSLSGIPGLTDLPCGPLLRKIPAGSRSQTDIVLTSPHTSFEGSTCLSRLAAFASAATCQEHPRGGGADPDASRQGLRFPRLGDAPAVSSRLRRRFPQPLQPSTRFPQPLQGHGAGVSMPVAPPPTAPRKPGAGLNPFSFPPTRPQRTQAARPGTRYPARRSRASGPGSSPSAASAGRDQRHPDIEGRGCREAGRAAASAR